MATHTAKREEATKTYLDRWRLGVVSYLNARPLVAGLEDDPTVDLLFDVPAKLPGLLQAGKVDAALVPVIDLMRQDHSWRIVSDACIGCDGETFTVRVFSRGTPASIRRLHVDGDSHTSVALATILWRELYGKHLEVVPWLGRDPAEECEAILLIGDKVVTQSPIGFEVETDLGSAWKSLTSLPFVFAAWASRDDGDTQALGRKLSQARDVGVRSAPMIAADLGPGMGWPVTLATRYLTSRLKFTLGPRQRLGMKKFFELAKKHGIVAGTSEPVFA